MASMEKTEADATLKASSVSRVAADASEIDAQIAELQQKIADLQKQKANITMAQPVQAPQVNMPAASGAVMPAIAPGVSSMLNSPENLQRISELLSRAEAGRSVDDVMEDILKETGMDKESFWSFISSINKTSAENPFAKKDEDGEKEEEEDSEDADKKAPPFGKKDDAGEDKSEDGAEKDEPKDEPADKKESESEGESDDEDDEPGTPEWEKKDMKLAKDALKKLKELVKREKKEREGAEVAKLEEAMDIIEKLMKGEEEEAAMGGHDIPPSPEGEEVALEKTGPDIPPAMEGVALPLPEPAADEGGMKVIELGKPAMPLFASMADLADRISRYSAGQSSEDVLELRQALTNFTSLMEQNMLLDEQTSQLLEQLSSKLDVGGELATAAAKAKPESSGEGHKVSGKSAGLRVNDRVWRKADFEQGFETAGDEPGRVVAIGNGKAIVDWGHGDDILAEEEPSDLMIAHAAHEGEIAMFAQPQEEESDVEPLHASGPMGQAGEIETVLRETSLHDMLARQSKDMQVEPETVFHIASGKRGRILQRLAAGKLRVSVDGKELVLWPYEVE
jgi:hypothetical protein